MVGEFWARVQAVLAQVKRWGRGSLAIMRRW